MVTECRMKVCLAMLRPSTRYFSNNSFKINKENKYSLSKISTVEEAKYISSLRDIDLKSDETSANLSFLLITSSGLSAETLGWQLGIYKEAGTYNNSPFYRQVDTAKSLRSDEIEKHLRISLEDHLLYKHWSGHWVVRRGRGSDRGLWSRFRSDSVPLTGWCLYVGSQYRVDPHLNISPVIPMACGDITIEFTGYTVFQQPNCLGDYTPTKKFSAGRRVFKHKTQERYLFVGSGVWFVKKSVDSSKGPYMHSGCAPSMCPADPRARSRVQTGQAFWGHWNSQNWTYIWGITIKCSVHIHLQGF